MQSILNQGLEEDEYEVIVVNDGSKDQGPSIVESFAKIHPNFILVNKENGGVSSARNMGMDLAKGEYIYFMDADDLLLPDGMKVLRDTYLNGKAHPDVLTFWSRTVDSYYNPAEYDHIRPHRQLFRGGMYDYGKEFYPIAGSVCSKLISLKFLKEIGLKFKPYRIGEDYLFSLQLLEYSHATIVATDLNIYRYIVRGQSAITGYNKHHISAVLDSFLSLAVELTALKERTIYDGSQIMHLYHMIQRQYCTRLLSTNYSYTELIAWCRKSHEIGLFPIDDPQSRLQSLMNMLMKSPFLLLPLSFFYRLIFIPYIKPYIKRN